MFTINQDHPIFVFSQLIVAAVTIIGPLILFLNKNVLSPLNDLKKQLEKSSRETEGIKRSLEELKPNHGGSIKDKVNKIAEEMGTVVSSINHISLLSYSQLNLLDFPISNMNISGDVLFMNDNYIETLEIRYPFHIESNFRLLIHKEDLPIFEDRWQEFIKYKKSCSFNIRLQTLMTKRIVYCKLNLIKEVDRDGNIIFILNKITLILTQPQIFKEEISHI